ncbi:UNKNOWN [Stylonychia lemnae]|uniref:Transmembrane protein n=1 Tax=Stylonychia lemnae TaxID=5949 RepID=A0A077ZW91_STYLE|nr:UNKNOWN [Stylonychia lemnae]|eukprot:CDW74139.1 UNKNOWN [Stylonychia lemnae]
MYGHNNRFLYQGEQTMKTLPGALATMGYVVILILYLVYQLQSLGQVTQVLYHKNFIGTSMESLTLNENNFFIEVSVAAPATFKDLQEVDSYLSVYGVLNIYDINGTQGTPYSRILFEKCSHNEYYYDGFVSFCLPLYQRVNIGSRLTKFNVYVTKCSNVYKYDLYPRKRCGDINDTQLFQFIEEKKIQIRFQTQYFDENSTEFYNQHNDYIPLTLYSQFQTQQVVQLSTNKIKYSNSLLHESLDIVEKEFLSTKKGYINRYPLNTTTLQFLDIQYEISNEQEELVIVKTNLVQILSSVGGLAGSIYFIIKLFMNPIQSFIYYQSIIKQTYLVDQTALNDKKKKLKQNDDDEPHQQPPDLESKQNDKPNLLIRGQDLKGQTQAQNMYTFFLLIQVLLQRNPFSYSPIFAFGTYIKSLVMFRRKYIYLEIHRMGKELIEKQLDVSIMLRDLRTLKMSNNLLLSKFQKRLIPFLQPYLLNKKLEAKQLKQDENSKMSKEERLKKFQNEKLSNLIEFFVNYQKQCNDVDKAMFDQLMQDKEKDTHSLEVQIFSGILRQYVADHLKTLYENQIIHPPTDSKILSDQQKVDNYPLKTLQIIQASNQAQRSRRNSYIGPQENENDDKNLFVLNESHSDRGNNAADKMELLQIADENNQWNVNVPKISSISPKKLT